jgi:hypothetical protein
MPPRKESSPKEKAEAGKSSGKAESITCKHCRYERPAQGKQCPICGYPWPWMK